MSNIKQNNLLFTRRSEVRYPALYLGIAKVVLMMQYPASGIKGVSEEKKQIVKNLYLSNIGEEFIAMQVDLEIPLVIRILKELDVYKGGV